MKREIVSIEKIEHVKVEAIYEESKQTSNYQIGE